MRSGTYSSTSDLSTLLYKLFKLVGTVFDFSMSYLSTSDFKLAKSYFLAKDGVSTPDAHFKSVFVAQLDKCSSTFTFAPKEFVFGKYSPIYIMSLLSIQILNELSYPFHLTSNLSPFILITFSIRSSSWFLFGNSFSQNIPTVLPSLKQLITYVHGTAFLTFLITKTSLDQFGI